MSSQWFKVFLKIHRLLSGLESPLKGMTGLDPTLPIGMFYRSSTASTVTLENLTSERALNVERLSKLFSELRLIVQNALQDNRERHRSQSDKGQVPNFTEEDFVLVTREELFASEKLSLCWRGPRSIVLSVNGYV